MTEENRPAFIEQDMKRKFRNSLDLFQIPNNAAIYKKRIPSGISTLDMALCGGFSSGLHCIGAISSLGKSTLTQQIAENIAGNGVPVIIFSLEMKTLDLAAKAISRRLFVDYMNDKKDMLKTSAELLDQQQSSLFTHEEWEAISKATNEVKASSEDMTIVECGLSAWSADKIGKYVQDYIQAYQVSPFVIIDYLQIIDPPKTLRTASDKQIADYNIKRLKTLADYFDIPVLVISSSSLPWRYSSSRRAFTRRSRMCTFGTA